MRAHTTDHPAIAVFTSMSRSRILAEGGSSAWVLNRSEAEVRTYLVCVRNSQRRDPGSPEPHRSAFLVGRGLGFEQLERRNGFKRWKITLSEYASIETPPIHDVWRNPVRYVTLEGLGISVDELVFEPLSKATRSVDGTGNPGLSIEEAKAGLATRFGVRPDAIEIIIRG